MRSQKRRLNSKTKHPNFRQLVLSIIGQIPPGKVATYGQVAAMAGSPRAARQVGWVLASLSVGSDLPWWRVVNSKGYLSIRGHEVDAKALQKQHLLAEGVEVNDEYLLDLGKCRWVA